MSAKFIDAAVGAGLALIVAGTLIIVLSMGARQVGEQCDTVGKFQISGKVYECRAVQSGGNTR